jgi:hypothetical protein
MTSFFDDVETKLDEKAEEDSQALSGTVWNPDPGEMLQGALTRAEVVKAAGRRSIVLNVKNVGKEDSGGIAPGETATIWGSRTVLKSALLREQPALGKRLAIRFDGTQESQSGNEFFMYTVLCEEADPALWTKLEADLEKRGFDDDSETPGKDTKSYF